MSVDSDRWGSWLVRRDFAGTREFTDTGEELAFDAVREELTGARILDLGIGAGRTTAFLAALTPRYVGSDLSPQMVERARRLFPTTDFRVVDARDLSEFEDESFDAVVFSFNGLDAVDRPGRAAVLSEVRRVLVPGGLAWISMLNLDCTERDAKPSLRRLVRTKGWNWRRPINLTVALLTGPLELWYYPRVNAHSESGDGWARRPLAAHEFRFLVHFTRFSRGVQDLEDAGLVPERAFGSDGVELDLAADRVQSDFWHFLARKPS